MVLIAGPRSLQSSCMAQHVPGAELSLLFAFASKPSHIGPASLRQCAGASH